MTYIKRLVMQGFKSFASRTEITFNKGVNVIIGPNGSGKSNISDALCFVLGRRSTKSIRAAKAQNLLFMGSKYAKPAHEAYVEIIFGNENRTFPIDKDEISLIRIVKRNGIGVYKINNETKTLAEVSELINQAGIDPDGFNLILQGQIQSIVRMHPEDRRRIIEEVAGISIYETRKAKSLHELEKTEEKLKEINAILRERGAFLKNLENERQQAIKFKEIELTIKRCKASILRKKIDEKDKEKSLIIESITEKLNHKDRIHTKLENKHKKVEEINERIIQINKHIQHATGIEQEKLHSQISDLKAELEGIRVRKESFEHRKKEIEKRIEEIKKSIYEGEKEIYELKKESPIVAKKQEQLLRKKQELARLEDLRKETYNIKTELNSVKDRIKDKESERSRLSGESDSLIKSIEEYSINLKHKNLEDCEKAISYYNEIILEKRKILEKIQKEEIALTKEIAYNEREIYNSEKIKSNIEKLDVCPLCKTKITKEHINEVINSINNTLSHSRSLINSLQDKINLLNNERDKAISEYNKIEKLKAESEKELTKHNILNQKKMNLKNVVDQENKISDELKILFEKRDYLQQKTSDISLIEENYKNILSEIEEISSRTEDDIDRTLLYKERELEKMKEVIKISTRDLKEIEHEISEFKNSSEEKLKILKKKEIEEKELSERFKKLFIERDRAQEIIKIESQELSNMQKELHNIEEQINQLKINEARIRAEKEALDMEFMEYSEIEPIKATMHELEEKIVKLQTIKNSIGPINMRAIEIYDEIKSEYDKIQEKLNILQKEKEDIMNIINEIDNKKKKTFTKTFNEINNLFSKNFSKLSSKGHAYLEIENPDDIFNGGVAIVIKMSRGKYFDVTSLSGGEQTLVALSLLFAIQEYKPYHFYIFDEIDAALDKRNSERLSALLKHYMKSGQYIVVTHNEAIITDSDFLYGVSMHDGVSKIFSLKLTENQERSQDIYQEN